MISSESIKKIIAKEWILLLLLYVLPVVLLVSGISLDKGEIFRHLKNILLVPLLLYAPVQLLRLTWWSIKEIRKGPQSKG